MLPLLRMFTSHRSRHSHINSVRMVHRAARDYAFSAKYDAAIQDPIFAASMRTELQQDDNGGVKSLLYDRQ